ncbi:branched-chain amino acid aminotransferase [Pedobacter sp. SYSU D00535]|uniref:branched-chain amino acid aminotransferase n=1 Tax=Pedobacter sp. SYSU D00535 TaxID=2810308 RepID=UPI001A97C96E
MADTLDIKISKTTTSKLPETDFSNLPFGKIFSDHMFVADYDNGEWKNFEIVPYGNLSFSPAMASLHYGQTFFEGLKAFKQKDGKIVVFRPYKNAQRFNLSAARMCMPALSEEIFVKSIAALVDLDRNWVPDAANHSLYIRPFMFATDPYLGVQPSKSYKYMILTCPVGAYFAKPLKVKIENKYSRASEGGFGFAKAGGNYGGSLFPAQEALKEGFDQVIWTDGKDHAFIEELGAANVMFVIDGTLVTPSTRDTILNGVTRDSVLTLARNWGVPVEERRVSVAEVIEGLKAGKLTEAFGVGTAATVTSIATIGYEGELYHLPEATADQFSSKALKILTDMRYGLAPDEFDWNYVI